MTATKKSVVQSIIDEQSWDNWEHTEEEQTAGKPRYWDVCQVLHCKLEHIREALDELETLPSHESGDDFESEREAIDHLQDLLAILDEEKLRSIEAGTSGPAKFRCEDDECDTIEYRDAQTMAEAGDQYCPKCGGDMEHVD